MIREFAIVKKYVTDLMREKTVILFFSLIFFIAISVSLLMLTVTFIYNPLLLTTQQIQIGIIEGYEFPTAFGTNRVNSTTFVLMEDALAAFDAGEIDVILRQRGPFIPGVPIIVEVITPTSPVTHSLAMSVLVPYFEKIESNLQMTRDLPGYIWHTQISTRGQFLNGTDVIFELIVKFIIPIFILIPAFIIGNLFVDSFSQEIEQKTQPTLFATISPRTYVHTFIIFGTVVSSILATLLLGILWLRFTFIQNIPSILLYVSIFSLCATTAALCITFLFPKKEISQLIFAFGTLTVFLFSPFITFFPLQTITRLIVGDSSTLGIAIIALLFIFGALYALLYRKIAKDYYL